MPLYDYECDACNYVTEHFFHMKDKPRHAPCSQCGEQARAVVAAPAVQMGEDWSNENGGKGRKCMTHKGIYSRSPSHLEEQLKSRGYETERY